jgi:hypothetical protein
MHVYTPTFIFEHNLKRRKGVGIGAVVIEGILVVSPHLPKREKKVQQYVSRPDSIVV